MSYYTLITVVCRRVSVSRLPTRDRKRRGKCRRSISTNWAGFVLTTWSWSSRETNVSAQSYPVAEEIWVPDPCENKNIHHEDHGPLSTQIKALRRAYSRSGGSDPDLVAQMMDLQAEAQRVEENPPAPSGNSSSSLVEPEQEEAAAGSGAGEPET
ncbi:hypothetical protein EYF80_054995 [Liparis tanakae]|uniref:Uncharacterized protein n=1 Tax=Liparis tanakae TaxID=230148 RepID=A0A4Z2F127_9TELE|nr:hypothetical protein EYF80_054995 [Liparis tanakae]